MFVWHVPVDHIMTHWTEDLLFLMTRKASTRVAAEARATAQARADSTRPGVVKMTARMAGHGRPTE